ncbi:MAG: S1 RNA-binding domain-containing protein [Anaerolineales bacterium]|nr:S1 RNA-binding domain-containing protein [Anaerolineales bacterium]
MVNAANGELSHPMDFLLSEEFDFPKAGDIRKGSVVAHRNNEILVDIGAKSEGIIDPNELQELSPEAREELEVGNDVDVFIVDPEDQNGNVILSYTKAAEERDWLMAKEFLESQEVCECRVVGFNRGGVLAALGVVRGFIPNSQLSRDRHMGNDQPSRQRAFQALMGTLIRVKIVEVDHERNRLIISEQAASKEIRAAKRADLISDINVGDVFDGKVVNLADFGAFVDIGGIEGLVHLSELSWKRVNNPADLLHVGDEVKVSVLSIDNKQQRIALSIKRLQADPWTTIDDTYRVGQLIEALVTRLTKFGAFARLNDDYQLEGLIHISEMAEDRIGHPREVISQGDKVMVRIIRIDPEQRQLGLSLKQVSSDKFIEADMAMLNAAV